MQLRICSLVLFVLLSASAMHAATLASNGFEGDAGDLPFSMNVSDAAEGEITTQSNPPVFSGSQSLMFNKIGDQPQIDFDVAFDTVDVSNVFDVALEFHWHANINDNPYETADSLTFTANHDGTGGPIVLSFDNDDLNAARNGTSTDEWQDILIDIPDDATMLDFSFNANFNAENEDMFFDQLSITGTRALVPEPASIALWSLLGVIAAALGGSRWARSRTKPEQ